MKLKHIILQTILMAGATWSLTSCNDFLDMAPLDQVTPQEYFNTTDHLHIVFRSTTTSFQRMVDMESVQ